MFWAGCGAVRREEFLEIGGFDGDRFPRPTIEDIERIHTLTSDAMRGLASVVCPLGLGLLWTARGVEPRLRMHIAQFSSARGLNQISRSPSSEYPEQGSRHAA